MQYDRHVMLEKQRGYYAEFGNIELSYNYLMRVIKAKNLGQSIQMLDIGTNLGTLPFLVYTREKLTMFGVEKRSISLEKGKNKYSEIADKLSIVDGSLKSFPDEMFDVVTMFDVIEHIPRVEDYLKNDVFRVLKPGGVFVFQTPNARINPIYEIIDSKSLTAYKSEHCSLQTPKSLRNNLIAAGFCHIVIEKNTLDSEFNRQKLKKYGLFGLAALKIFSLAPLGIYPNLWGYCDKPKKS